MRINTALWNTIQLLFPKFAANAPPVTPAGILHEAVHGRQVQTRHMRVANVLAAGQQARARFVPHR